MLPQAEVVGTAIASGIAAVLILRARWRRHHQTKQHDAWEHKACRLPTKVRMCL